MDWIRRLAAADPVVYATPDVKLEGWGDLASLHGRVSRKFISLLVTAARHRGDRLAAICFPAEAALFERDFFPFWSDELNEKFAPFGRGLSIHQDGDRTISLFGIDLRPGPKWLSDALSDSGVTLPDHHHRFAVGVTKSGSCLLGAY